MEKDKQLLSAKRQLKLFGNFLENHSNNLNSLLSDESNRPLPTIPIHYRPFLINYSSNREKISKFKLIDSDNKIFNKIILTFSYLCDEIYEIVKESYKLQEKFLYINEDLCSYPSGPDALDLIEPGGSVESDTEDCLIKISNSMEFLCEIQFIINGGIQMANTLLQQLTMFHSIEKSSWGFQYNLQFTEVFTCLENLMIIIVIFDEILYKSNFHKFWPSYKTTIIQSFQKEKFTDLNCNENEINGLITVLNEMEVLFAGNIFQNFLESTIRSKERLQATKGLGQFSICFNEHIKNHLQNIRKFPANISEFNETKSLIAANIFTVLHHQFFGQIDQKMFKQLLEFNTKYNGLTLIGSTIWYPEHFLKRHAETLMINYEKYFQDSTKSRQNYLQDKVQHLPQLVKKYCVEVTLWTLRINAVIELGTNDLRLDQFKPLCSQFLQGIQMAGQISHLIKSITNLHVLLHIPMQKLTLNLLCKLIEILKLIQMTLSNDMENITNIMKHIKQCLQYKSLHIIILTKKKLTGEQLNDQIIDTISAIRLIEKCLNGPPTNSRLFITNLLTQSQNLIKIITPEDYEKLQKYLIRLKTLNEFQIYMEHVCETSFLYWHQSLVKSYLNQIIDKHIDLNSYQYLVHSSDECCETLDKVGLNDLKSTELLRKSNYNQVKREIISKLCGNIETFLRIEVLSNLQLEKINPFEQKLNCDNRALINNRILIINGQFVSLQYQIENYLSNMFYNLTTIHLHDWKTYEEMRQLAKKKYKLEPIEDYLPTQTIEQGIDALEIMRNIHVFVTQYNYNMNNQYFVESNSKNKYLNTIAINHVANSIRVHGAGIINTTVNFSYQFLRRKFYTFSQFLYDQQINSRLMKELRYISELKRNDPNSKSVGGQFIYNYERAEEFNKEIRKLGAGSDGLSYMDMFRQLITQVGNTMGYIRLMRSGNVHANYTTSVYLPNFDSNLNFEELCTESNLNETTIKSAEILELNIKNYGKHFAEDQMDFFKLLVNAFKPFFENPNNLHLRNFYLIIPALILNYVDYILNARDRISKREKNGMVLFDDGFAMGLAYILKLCNQYSDFESLHWFKGIDRKFIYEHKTKSEEIQAEINKNPKDQSLLQTLALVEKRMKAKFREFSLLHDSLYSAKIFFQ